MIFLKCHFKANIQISISHQ